MLNQDRGRDSYGYYTPESGIIKDTGKVEECMTKNNLKVPESGLFIGHVRSSTVGASTKDNAHPFNYGNIVLAMNGTLSNHWSLCKEEGWDIMDYNVDSQVLAAMLNKYQTKEPLTKIIGGCAVVYTDTTTNKLYVYRNIERPLFRGNIDECMYISSVENSLKIIGCSDVKEFKENNLYEIVDGKITGTYHVTRAVEKVVVADYHANRSYLNVNFHLLESKDLIGRWLTPKNTVLSNSYSFYQGFAYECVNASSYNKFEIFVIDDNGRTAQVPKYKFEEKIPVIYKNDHVFATKNLKYQSGNGAVFCSKGDLLFVANILGLDYVCRNTETNQVCHISKDSFRLAMPEELKFYNSDKEAFLSEKDYPTHPKDGQIAYDNFMAEPIKPEKEVIITTYNKETGQINREVKKDLQLEIAKLPAVNEDNNLSVDELFELEVKNTATPKYEDLAQFTIDQLQDLVDDLDQCKQSAVGESCIKNMKVVITNYQDKYVKLLKEQEYAFNFYN